MSLLLIGVLVATALLSLVSQSPRWLGGGVAVLLCLFYPVHAFFLLLFGAAVFLFIHHHNRRKRKFHRANLQLPDTRP
ncbi:MULTISPECIES: hypothetical protein [unclassified Polaromonas]|uniref:hypothetical protein n=1 Tax=unclassified Polaromonas TaxID=2638319 RepID=UPI00129EA25F|nr:MULTISPECIES: hypothetical protein [unclassified Polaromonas]QGJ18245.1 hypothetical protein F7R28_07460 [Polaromonas sp. Pch-P]